MSLSSRPAPFYDYINTSGGNTLSHTDTNANYKAIKQKSDSSLKSISRNLKQIVANNDSLPEQNNTQGDYKLENNENKSLVKIRQIHKNEKVLKQQLDGLVNSDFKAFHKKLIQFNAFINLHFDMSSNAASESYNGAKTTSGKSVVKAIKKNDKLSQKISRIQFFAEQLDQKIRILELTRKTIENNKQL